MLTFMMRDVKADGWRWKLLSADLMNIQRIMDFSYPRFSVGQNFLRQTEAGVNGFKFLMRAFPSEWLRL